MDENQLLERIYNVAEYNNRVRLANFWLQMDAHQNTRPFTFDDLRHLDADGRVIFHSLLGGYSRRQFAPLSIPMITQLEELIRGHHNRNSLSPLTYYQTIYYPALFASHRTSRPLVQ